MMEKIAKRLFWGAVVEFLLIWVLPFVVTGVSIVIGLMHDFTWFYIYIGAVITFSAISIGLLSFSKWRYRSKVQDKLVFSSVRVNQRTLDNSSEGSMCLGFAVISKALFPIEFKVERLVTSVGNNHSPKKDYTNDSFVIPIKGDGWFDDHSIDIKQKLTTADEGVVDFELSYGRPGNLKYKLKQKKRVYFNLSEDGRITTFNWIDD